MEGFSNIFVKKYITDVLLTSIILALFLTFAVQRVSSFKIKTAVLLLFCLFLAGWAFGAVYSVIVSNDYKNQLLEHYNDDGKWAHSDFFSKNYVFVDSIVNSNDSVQPRNLIFIIMESMETSFMDVPQKGNLITELTQVRGGEYNFSNSVGFGGGQDVEGSTNTITAIMAMIENKIFFIMDLDMGFHTWNATLANENGIQIFRQGKAIPFARH